jgi:predicted transposase YbfD/YdcC
VVEIFSQIQDFRVNRNQRHNLIDIITIAICATIAGCEGFNEIEDWGNAHESWLEKFLSLPNGIPSHDTFNRVFRLLDPNVFQQSFLAWISSINMLFDQRIVSIDGKTIRRSYDPINNKRPLHLVSAWACEANLSLGQVQVDEKSNEITAIPELLKILELKGAIVTLDAMGSQKTIAGDIIDRGADYVLALKKNHGDLFDDVETYFKLEPESSFNETSSPADKDHGRIETRVLTVAKNIDWLPQKDAWKGLKTVVRTCTTKHTPIGIFRTYRYFLTSLSPDQSEKIAQAIRSHWGIENNLHWVLDVVFNEDSSRVRDFNAVQNMALVRKMALSMLKNSPSHKGKSIKRKVRLAAMDTAFMQELIGVKIN